MGGFPTTTEFELSVTGSSKDLLGMIAVLAEQSINLDTVATAKIGDRYVIRFLTGCEEESRRTFIKADIPFKERRVLAIDMYNRPGQWLRAARCLVDSGIELDSSYLLGQKGDRLRFVFGVTDYQKAKKVAEQIAECSVD